MTNDPFMTKWIDGNPFITLLEQMKLTESELLGALEERDDAEEGFHLAPVATKITGLSKKFYLPPPYCYELYNHLYQMMLMGYLNRHPKTDDYDKYLHDIDSGAKKIREIPKPPLVIDAGTMSLATGRSGNGKSTLFDKLLGCFELKNHFHTPCAETGGRRLPQVLWVKVGIKSTRSQRPFLLSIINAIDEQLGSNLASRFPSATVGDEISYVIKMCRMVGLGLLVVDDVQFLLNAKKTKGANKLTNEFLEDLYNDLCVPMFLIGTPEVTDVFAEKGQLEQTERRLISNGFFQIPDYAPDSVTWAELVKASMLNFLCLKPDWLNEDVKQLIYYYCEGNIGKLKRLTGYLLKSQQKVKKENLPALLYEAHCGTHIRCESIKPRMMLGGRGTSSQKEVKNKPIVETQEKQPEPIDPKVQARLDRIKAFEQQDMED